ncbi:MAG TPA: hypothetical protein VEZ42_20285 [Pseudonocardia sp.]|nr:hypothetical protein [Pseudonocardia sp.]
MLVAALVAGPGAAPSPEVRCTVTDPELAELSGLLVEAGAAVAMADGGRRVLLHRLDGVFDDGPAPRVCVLDDTRTVDINPYDAEDLARGPDGALWVADTGDNDRRRETVAVIVVPADGEARLHRLTYPDGPHDAEALLVDPAGRPVIVTKDLGQAGVYRTAEPPDGVGPTPLVRVGEVVLPPSDSSGGPLGSIGARLVTGAAATADGRVVALRTYTDAWLYPAPEGDPATALTENPAPVRVPLPDEPQGEAIAFAPDGTLLSGSEARAGVPGEIRAVSGAAALAAGPDPGSAPPVAGPATAGSPSAEPRPGEDAAGEWPWSGWPPAAIGGAAAVGLLLAAIAAMLLRGRRR